jgi:MarR-like DNA-binding transcriptional regulator SgrR of sgrS sRNA
MRWIVFRRFAISLVIAMITLPVAARTRPHYGGTLHVEIEGDPWQRPDGIARRLVFDGLTTLDARGTVQSALATGWETDSGDHRWQFRLRPGVQFHDGSPLTATAVVQSLNLDCPANCPWAAVRAVGSTVVFTSDAPMPNLPALLAGDQFLIALTVTENGETPHGNIGTGPFQVTSFSDELLALAANETCWQGRPFADAIEIRAHRPVHDQWLDLSIGRADLVEVPAEMLRQAQQQRLTVLVSPPATLLALEVTDAGTLSNPMMRAAIAASIDRSALSNVIFQKQGEATASLLPQSLTGFSFLFPVDRDLNKAHELRGGLNTPTLTLSVDGDGAMRLASQRIALNMKEAGFNVQEVNSGGSPHADLMLRMIPLEGGEPSAVLESVSRSVGTAATPAGASPASLYKTERDFLERHTLIPLVDLPRAFAMGSRVRGLALDADGLPDLAGASLGDAP